MSRNLLPIYCFCFFISNCAGISISTDNKKPDLWIYDMDYVIAEKPRPKSYPGNPMRAMGGVPKCICSINLLVENRGGIPWQGELMLGYTFSKKDFDEKNYERYELKKLEPAAMLEPQLIYEYAIDLNVHCAVENIYFVLNPEYLEQQAESFYKNNEWIIKN